MEFKLTQQDKELLQSWGETDPADIAQIELAAQQKYTKYEIINAITNKTIAKNANREIVIWLLGRENYLSGLRRSAFHCTAERASTNHECVVFFNSYNLLFPRRKENNV